VAGYRAIIGAECCAASAEGLVLVEID